MKYKCCLLLVTFLFFSIMGEAQSEAALHYHPNLIGTNFQFPDLFSQYSLFGQDNAGDISQIKRPENLGKKWDDLEVDINSWPVFCRIEVQVEKAVNVPIKFRLGEVQYVERMEGKY